MSKQCLKKYIYFYLKALHMLQNKELLSLKQWHFKIGYTDRTVSFIVSNGISCYHSDRKLHPEERN